MKIQTFVSETGHSAEDQCIPPAFALSTPSLELPPNIRGKAHVRSMLVNNGEVFKTALRNTGWQGGHAGGGT